MPLFLDTPTPLYLDFMGPYPGNPCVEIEPPALALTFSDTTDLEWVEHCAEGRGKLLEQFKGKELIEELLCSYLCEVQELENVVWAVKLLMTLETATGVQLDGVGARVGAPPRAGMTDDQYRLVVRIQIAIILSDGQRPDLLGILRIILGATASIFVREYWPATILYHPVEPLPVGVTTATIKALLKAAKAAGVKLYVMFTFSPSTDTFYGDSVHATVTASGQRPGSVHDATVGGDCAHIQE